MQTIINVVNGRVLVKTDGKEAHEYNYSAAKYLSAKSVTVSLLGPNVLKTNNPEKIKAAYSKAGDMLGVSVAQYVRQVKGAAKRAYIDPINDLVKRFCLVRLKPYSEASRWGIDPYRVDVLNEYKNVVQGYIDDGNNHLAAYGMLIGNSKEAKHTLGKGFWKKVCRTSRTRNDLIWGLIHNDIRSNMYGTSMNMTKLKALIMYYHNIPTTLLRLLGHDYLAKGFYVSYTYGIDNLVTRVVKHLGGPMSRINKDAVQQQMDIVNDVAGMRDGFNSKWSITRMNNEHEAAMRDHHTKLYSKDIYHSAEFLTNKYEHKGCTAEMIKSSFELAEQGQHQRHCVANYANKCAAGGYVVYRIVDGEGVISTLGITNPNTKSYRPTQHYLAHNKVVENKDALGLAEIIKTDVTKIMKDHPEIALVPPCQDFDDDIPF
jgi:hypothetical protein